VKGLGILETAEDTGGGNTVVWINSVCWWQNARVVRSLEMPETDRRLKS